MRRWLLTFYSRFAQWRAARAGDKADKWIARAKWAEREIKKMDHP